MNRRKVRSSYGNCAPAFVTLGGPKKMTWTKRLVLGMNYSAYVLKRMGCNGKVEGQIRFKGRGIRFEDERTHQSFGCSSHEEQTGFKFYYGNLNFNDELPEMDKAIGDYVIVHELLHFKVPNHGKLWKSLMRVYLGAWVGGKHQRRWSESGRSSL